LGVNSIRLSKPIARENDIEYCLSLSPKTFMHPEQTQPSICENCSKPKADSKRVGSLTSFLFRSSYCTCSEKPATGSISKTAINLGDADNFDFCPDCGLKIVTDVKDGSLTAFLFFYTRCKCPANKAFAAGNMSARLQKLRQDNATTIFREPPEQASSIHTKTIALAPDAVIGGVYRIIDLIGRGGMGEVYLARHVALGKKCALKVIPPDQVTQIGWLRFQQEAKAVAKFDHINLVRVTDLGLHEGCLPFYAMDYVEGKNLAEILADSGRLPLPAVLDIFIQVCEGVDYSHRHDILHRDLKPANIMLTETNSEKPVVKILDFGLAKLTKHDRTKQSLTSIGEVFGSPFYMSPEQCSGDKLDRRSDIYSVGCTIFECLTGQPPFTDKIAAAIINRHLSAEPPALESIAGSQKFPVSMEVVMAKLLRKNPVERYQTFLELRDDLQKVARGESVEPFYVSRSRPALPSETRTNLEGRETFGTNIDDKSIAKNNWLVGALAAILLVTVIFTASKSLHIDKKKMESRETVKRSPNKSAKVAATVTNQRSQGLPAQTQLPPFSTTTPKSIIFDFPTESMGLLSYEAGTNNSSQNTHDISVDCRNRVIMPLGRHLRFLPSSLFMARPEYFDRFRPDDINTISFEALEETTPLTDATVAHITHLTGLTTVKFNTCDSITNKSLTYLEKLPNLRALAIEDTPITAESLAKTSFLRRLTNLRLEPGGKVSDLLAALKGSEAMENLWISGSALTLSDYQMIGTLKKMRTLAVPYCGANDADVMAISDLPLLQELNMAQNKITRASEPALKKLLKQNLKTLTIKPTSLSPDVLDSLIHAGIDVKIK